jgi:hypothetical protein
MVAQYATDDKPPMSSKYNSAPRCSRSIAAANSSLRLRQSKDISTNDDTKPVDSNSLPAIDV